MKAKTSSVKRCTVTFHVDLNAVDDGRLAINLNGDCSPVISAEEANHPMVDPEGYVIVNDLLERYLRERKADMSKDWSRKIQADHGDMIIENAEAVAAMETAFRNLAARCREWLDAR